MFVGYCEVLKAFRNYIPGYHHIEINRDVTFDKDAALKKSRRCVGYCEVLKAFRNYIPGYHHIEINRDVTFDKDAALKKSRRCQLEEVYEEESIAPRVAEPVREVTNTLMVRFKKIMI
jgi:hypothetical protein